MRIAEQLRQRSWEATESHEELQIKYKYRVPLMRRRFRLERTLVGNSCLVTHQAVKDLRRQHGGTIVEVLQVVPIAERQARDLAACPYCKAESGKPCATANGKPVVPHLKRWEL